MLKLQFPESVKFICGFIYVEEKTYQQAKHILERKFGPIDYESQEINFNFTDYYQPEMGPGLKRRFISFKSLRLPEKFVSIKLFCVKLERKFASKGKRTVNIDPGYINEAKLVLTTTKDFSHRIYLGKGVFAEVTLSFKEGNFHHSLTTFPDYRTDLYKSIFNSIRKTYRQDLRHEP